MGEVTVHSPVVLDEFKDVTRLSLPDPGHIMEFNLTTIECPPDKIQLGAIWNEFTITVTDVSVFRILLHYIFYMVSSQNVRQTHP